MHDWKNMLLAVDDTPTSRKAVQYTADIVANLQGVRICLLHIYPEPPPDYYRQGRTLDQYRQENDARAERIFREATGLLAGRGVPAEAIRTRSRLAEQQTISQTIMAVQAEEKAGTVVVGKRGVSKAEEFLFGSISSALIHQSRDFTVWVVG